VSVGDWRQLTGVDEHVPVEWALRAEHFATDRTSVGCGGQSHEVVWADVLRQVVVAGQTILTHRASERLLAVVTGVRQYLHTLNTAHPCHQPMSTLPSQFAKRYFAEFFSFGVSLGLWSLEVRGLVRIINQMHGNAQRWLARLCH